MNNEIYYYETIDELEKAIIDKSLNLDIVNSQCNNLFNCFVRTIRTIMIWIIFITFILIWIRYNFIMAFNVTSVLLIVYLFGSVLMSWVRFNSNREFLQSKARLIDRLTDTCKEYKEANYTEWQCKQMLKRFTSLANLKVDWYNAK